MLQIGDLREALGLEMQKNLVDLIDRNQWRRFPYYIVIKANFESPESNNIKTVFVLTSKMPPKLLGTICIYVNNFTGDIQKIWALPLDRPHTQFVEGSPNEKIFYDAAGMPIINS